MDRLEAGAIDLPGVRVTVMERCSSTNDVLLESSAAATPSLLAAEIQTAGRGRRGRRWHSSPGAGITFSLAQRVQRPLGELSALSLVAGVATARALRALGASQTALKWPNDLVVGEAKLGGILVETRNQSGGTLVVIGVGINMRNAAQLEARLRRRVASLEQLLASLPQRSEVIRAIGGALLDALHAFDARGFDASRADWEAMDAHSGRRLRVRLADGRVLTGVASGLAEDGGLRLRTRAGMRAIHSGRVLSSRAA
jgi:BirA family transcriptional regulator, biotin operon repressor / biotin---[acetyl-CoA-carboxylase] ligase